MEWRVSLEAALGVALIAVFAVLVAGCGEDEPREVSADELVERGDEICAEGQERFAEIQEEPLRNATDAAEQTRELIGVAEEQIDELRDLIPPDSLRAPYRRYLDARVRAMEILEQGLDAAERRDDEAFAAAQVRVAASADKRRRLARAVGFRVCSAGQR